MHPLWSALLAPRDDAPPFHYVYGVHVLTKKGVCCPVHSHKSIEIVYHATGSGKVRLGKRSVAFPEGGVTIHAPEEPHDQVMNEAGEDICVQVAVPRPKALAAAGTFTLPRIQDPSLAGELEYLGRGHAQPDRITQTILNLRATGLLLGLLREAAFADPAADNPRSGEETYVRRAEKHMRENYRTIVSIRSVADHAGVGYDHLRHLFKAHRGKSLVRFLSEVRMERAKTHLVHSQLAMKQIAALCGFRDEYYFSAVFRNFVGVSPLAYRRRHA